MSHPVTSSLTSRSRLSEIAAAAADVQDAACCVLEDRLGTSRVEVRFALHFTRGTDARVDSGELVGVESEPARLELGEGPPLPTKRGT